MNQVRKSPGWTQIRMEMNLKEVTNLVTGGILLHVKTKMGQQPQKVICCHNFECMVPVNVRYVGPGKRVPGVRSQSKKGGARGAKGGAHREVHGRRRGGAKQGDNHPGEQRKYYYCMLYDASCACASLGKAPRMHGTVFYRRRRWTSGKNWHPWGI